MRIGPHVFNMKRYEDMDMDKLNAFVEAINLYRAKRQEVENVSASLTQFLEETFAEIDSNYDCEVYINGEPWQDAKFTFKPSL